MSAIAALRKAEDDVGVERHLALAMCERINTPHSLAISMAISSDDWDLYKELAPDPRHYIDTDLLCLQADTWNLFDRYLPGLNVPGLETFRLDRQVSRLLVKSSLQDTGYDTKARALALFVEIEGKVASRHQTRLRAPWLLELSYEVNRMLSKDGSQFLTPEALEEIVVKGRLGPGSTPTVSASRPQSEKLRRYTSVSPQLVTFVPCVKRGVWEDDQPGHVLIEASEITTVPKSAWIDRTIASVPVIDMYLQLGLAALLEKILRKEGIDIRNQNRNGNLASRARDLSLATIDLSSASSWFSERNLEDILPPDLMILLSLIRPRFWTIRSESGDTLGPKQPYFNWLPMGCGYTFNLMTLYFWALVKTVVPRSALNLCSVYGDDIILPQKYAVELINRLEYLGFEVNREKSYLDGNFFESCGTEWFASHDVLPFYSRKGITVDGADENVGVAIPYRVQLANKLRLWSSRPSNGMACDKKWYGIWASLIDKKRVPPKLKPCVPPHLGDVGLMTSLGESKASVDVEKLICGWEPVYSIATLRKRQVTVQLDDPFAYQLWLMLHTRDAHMVPTSPPFIWEVVQGITACREWQDSDAFLRVSLVGLCLRAEPLFTFGEEPLRGFFGKSITKMVTTLWPSGFEWVNTA
jgi:hypothetical protein